MLEKVIEVTAIQSSQIQALAMIALVSLQSSDFDKQVGEKLKELANANAEEIEKRALEMWETKAIPWLKVSMEIRSSGGRDILDSEEFEFRTDSYLLNPSGKFTIKEEARQRFDKMLTGWARHMMELQFGEHMSKINYINERCHKADILWKRMLTPAICAGIVAFIMFVCLIWVLLNIQ